MFYHILLFTDMFVAPATVIRVIQKNINNMQISAIICILFVFLYDTLMMVTYATKTCQCIIYDQTYYTDMHLLVYYTS